MQLSDLVRHERNQRGNNESNATKHYGGQLEAKTLAGASGHHAYDVVTGEDVFNDFALSWPKLLKPKNRLQD